MTTKTLEAWEPEVCKYTLGFPKNPVGFTVQPREAYFSKELYEQELEKIFRRQWLLVGHVSRVKNNGDYYVRQVGPESMIIARDNSGQIRAYFNVCRHRGSRLLADGDSGCARGITCPYHHWAYDMDGKLRSVPGARDGQYFDFAGLPLHEAKCSSYYGWIYVWLGENEPPALVDVLSPVTDQAALDAVNPERMKVIHQEVYVMDCNWKTFMENSMECYHCPHGGHVDLSRTQDYYSFWAGKVNPRDVWPLKEGMESFSMDGKRVCTIPLGVPGVERFNTGFPLLPLTTGPYHFIDYAFGVTLTPLSVDKTHFICEWYVHEDAVEGVHYDVENVTRVLHITNLEDGQLSEQNYKGITSARFKPGPHHPIRESGVGDAYRRYWELMNAE